MKISFILKSCVFVLLLLIVMVGFAQTPPPPPPPGQPTDHPAPLGSGIAVLASLAAAYGATLLYRANNKKLQ